MKGAASFTLILMGFVFGWMSFLPGEAAHGKFSVLQVLTIFGASVAMALPFSLDAKHVPILVKKVMSMWFVSGKAISWMLLAWNVRIEKTDTTPLPRSKKPLGLRFLSGFRWFLPRKRREEIDIIMSDLQKDVREMKRGGESKLLIETVIAWRTLETLGTYFSGTIHYLLSKAPLVLKFINRGG